MWIPQFFNVQASKIRVKCHAHSTSSVDAFYAAEVGIPKEQTALRISLLANFYQAKQSSLHILFHKDFHTAIGIVAA